MFTSAITENVLRTRTYLTLELAQAVAGHHGAYMLDLTSSSVHGTFLDYKNGVKAAMRLACKLCHQAPCCIVVGKHTHLDNYC